MKVSIKTIFYFAAALALFCHLQIADASAQQTKNRRTKKTSDGRQKTFRLKSKRGTIERGGKDPNIKIDENPVNNVIRKNRKPIAKGGAKTRGGGDCKVIFGNYTEFQIKLYVNGNYRGTVTSFNDAYLYVAPNPATTVYARADFADGTFLSWGPEKYDCGANAFVYYRLDK